MIEIITLFSVLIFGTVLRRSTVIPLRRISFEEDSYVPW